MASAIQTIRLEHFNVASVLTCLGYLLREIEEGRWVPDHRLLAAVIEYLPRYPAIQHHPKEDEYLFAAMRRRQPDLGRVLDLVHEEHERGARMLAALADAQEYYKAEPDGFVAFKKLAEAYIAFERRHMQREERELLPLALKILEPEDWHAIDAAFADNEDPLFGANRRREFKDLLDWILELAPSPLGFGKRQVAPI